MLGYLFRAVRYILWGTKDLVRRLRTPPDYVVFTLEGEYPELPQPPDNLILRRLRPPKISLQELAEQFRAIAGDGRISGVVLHLRPLDMPPAQLDSLRDLIHELRPLSMNGTRFDETVNEYIIEWAHQTGIRATYTVQGFVDLSLELKQAIYRILQEALANVARHSSAEDVEISLNFGDNLVELCLSDDGIGFDPLQQHGGMGLDSMRERAETFNGNFTIECEAGKGTKVRVTFPIK